PRRHLRGRRDDDRGVARRGARALRRHLPQRPRGSGPALVFALARPYGPGRRPPARAATWGRRVARLATRSSGCRRRAPPPARGTIDEVVTAVRQVADDGFATAWLPQIFAHDALTAIALAGREVRGIELGTSVIPTYPRHPMALAQQALSAQAAIGGRLVLGIGLSHQVVIEGMFGYSFDKPARHMREYLAILLPLVREGKVAFSGETLSANGAITVNGAKPFPVLLAALGPVMLRLAGAQADGTVTWMTGPATLESHIVPSINAAADAAGRGA